MSKQLIKILVICALVVLCPLVIVGVSLMATEAVGCTLTIFDGGIEKLSDVDYGGKESKVTIMVNGKEQKSNKVTLTKHTEVTVTFEGTGYDFEGWFSGKYNEINRKKDKAVSEKTSYKFEIKKDTVLTAVRDIKEYTVTYAGFYDDGTTAVDLDTATVEYNQPLAMLSPKAGGVQTGWYAMEQGVAGAVIKVANFANSGEVTVYPAWDEQMVVEYIKGGNVIAADRLFEAQVADYKLRDASDEVIKNNITVGYEFTNWTNQTGGDVVTSITYDKSGIKLVLNESLITYKLNVKYHALSNETTELTYNVKDGFTAYTETRNNYTLKGLEYAGTLYAYDAQTKAYGTLANVVLASGAKTFDMVAVWECNYPSEIIFTFTGLANYSYNGKTNNWVVKGTRDGQTANLYEGEQYVAFEDKEGEDYYDANTNLCEYFVNRYTNVQTLNGDAVNFTNKVTISVYVDGELQEMTYSHTITNSVFTFAEALDCVSDITGTLDNVTAVMIDFMYAVA